MSHSTATTATATTTTKLLTTRHRFGLLNSDDAPRFYELTAPFNRVSFELTETRQIKITAQKRERNEPIFNHLTLDAPLIAQFSGTKTALEIRAAIDAQQIAGDTSAIEKTLDLFAPWFDLIPAARDYKQNPHATPFELLARRIVAAHKSSAYNDGKLTGQSEAQTVMIAQMLKAVNFNTHKNAAFLEMLDSIIIKILTEKYELETATNEETAAAIYGAGQYRSPYDSTSCHDLSDASPRSNHEKQNIAAALATLTEEPAPGIAPSFEICALFDKEAGSYAARWIQRARGEKRGNAAKIYHSFSSTTEAERIAKMFGVNVVRDAYKGGIFKLATTDNNAILCLYCDDSTSRENIRIKKTSTGEDVLQYGGEKGDKIGKANNVNGTLSLSSYHNGFDDEPENHDEDSFRCDNCGDCYDNDDMLTSDAGGCYCSECHGELFTYCEDCDEYQDADSVHYIEVGHSTDNTGERNICECCLSDNYFRPPHHNNMIYYNLRFINNNLG